MSSTTTARDRLASSILDGWRVFTGITNLEMAEHLADCLIRDGWAPPADLPATLASVDDVRRVCEAAGLATLDEGRAWQTPDVLVVADHDPQFTLLIAWEVYRAGDDESMVAIQPSAPSSVLWHAIEAARSAS